MGTTKDKNQYVNITASEFSRRKNSDRSAKSSGDKFLSFLKLSPRERLRIIVLDEIGLSEKGLLKLDNSQRSKVETIISNKTDEKLNSSVYC